MWMRTNIFSKETWSCIL